MSDFLFRYHHDDGDVDDAYMHHGVSTLQESTQQMYEAYNRHFLGCDADDRRQSLLTNLIRLRHGLKFDEEVCRCTNMWFYCVISLKWLFIYFFLFINVFCIKQSINPFQGQLSVL